MCAMGARSHEKRSIDAPYVANVREEETFKCLGVPAEASRGPVRRRGLFIGKSGLGAKIVHEGS